LKKSAKLDERKNHNLPLKIEFLKVGEKPRKRRSGIFSPLLYQLSYLADSERARRGKKKWRGLKTKIFGVAKLRLANFEREVRAKDKRSANAATQIKGGKCGRPLEIYLADMRLATDTKILPKGMSPSAFNQGGF